MRYLIPILLLLALPLLAQEDMPEVARSLMEEAAAARDAKRVDEAIAKYTRVLEVAPTLASAYINLGALYFNQGKIDQAYATFAKGTENAPADRTLLSNAAATAQQLGKSDEALTYVDRAIEKNKRDSGLYSLRGTILRTLGRNDEALAALQTASQLSPDDAKVLFSFGNQLYQMGRKEEAINVYGRAVALDKSLIRAWYNLGAVYFETGRLPEALQAYKVALAPIEQSFAKGETVDPIHARAYLNLGGIYLKQQQWQPAADAYQKALRLDPKNTIAHYSLGFIYFTTNQPQKAEAAYQMALAADPSLPLAYLHLGEMAFKRGEHEKAVKFLRDGLPYYDRESTTPAYRTLARAELARGKRAEAIESLQKNADAESLLLLARVLRQDGKLPEAKAALDRVTTATPAVTFERLLVARAMSDFAAERTALDELLAKEPQRAAPLRAELGALLVRQGDLTAARSQPFVAAVNDALEGKREPAARALAQIGSPLARGDAGVLFWQLGKAAEAKPHLTAARGAFADWNEVTLAAGEIAYAERRYDDAVELLGAVKCEAPPFRNGLILTTGRNDDLCPRTRIALGNALVARAAELLADGSARQARALLERVDASQHRAVVAYLRGRIDLALGDDGGRDAIARAVSLGLPNALEAAAKRDLDATERAAEGPADPLSATPRRTVVVFLPDVPAENEKKLAEAINALVTQWGAAAGVPLEVELFRRADDARNFVAANRDKVGVVIANPDFARSLDFTPKFQFTREGSTSYRRVVIVRANSAARSLADLKGKSISGVEGFGDAGVPVTIHVPDDLTAAANAIYGKTEAALVHEANPLLVQHSRELQIVHTTPPVPLPVYAFGALPAADRAALYDAVAPRSTAALQMGGVTRLEREAKKRELSPISLNALALPRLADPPASIALRVQVEVPQVTIAEDLFGRP
jgi:tetratricopeptide (TPR) repeat protein